MDQSKPIPASHPQPSEAPPSSSARPGLRRSASVEEYIARMVAGLNRFKAER